MYFSKLVNFRKKPNKEIVEGNSKRIESAAIEGIKYLLSLWTLRRYDMVYLGKARMKKYR